MSTEALNRIIKEVNALTPQERRELIDRLAHEEQNSLAGKLFSRKLICPQSQLFRSPNRKAACHN